MFYKINNKENTTFKDLNIFEPILTYNSSWFLSKIRFPNSTDEIVLEYDTYVYKKRNLSENSRRIGSFGYGNLCSTIAQSGVVNVSQSETWTTPQVLNKILFPQGVILFNSASKNAVSSYGGAVLNSIEIKNNNNQIIEKYDFIYTNAGPDVNKTLTEIKKIKDNKILPYYKFDYYGVLPPQIDYKSQDYWENYNGNYNSNLIYGNRIASFYISVIGVLKKISYPAGGYTELEYEQNQISNSINNPFLPECSEDFYNESKENSSNSSGNSIATLTINIPVKQTVRAHLSASSRGLGFVEAFANISGSILAVHCYQSYSTSVSSTTEIGDPFNQYYISCFNVVGGDLILETLIIASGGFAASSIRIEYFDSNKVTFAQPLAPYRGGIRIPKIKDWNNQYDYESKRI
ncbi:MAG: hypothetical protein ACOH1N_12230 [Lutibacter sp.]